MSAKFLLGACCAGLVAVSSAMSASELSVELGRVPDTKRLEHIEVSKVFDRHLGPFSTPEEIESYLRSEEFDISHVTSGAVVEKTCADADRLLVAKRRLSGGVLGYREVQAIVCFRSGKKLTIIAHVTDRSL